MTEEKDWRECPECKGKGTLPHTPKPTQRHLGVPAPEEAFGAPNHCPTCNSGGKGEKPGYVLKNQVTCPGCGGKREVLSDCVNGHPISCPTCSGKGTVTDGEFRNVQDRCAEKLAFIGKLLAEVTSELAIWWRDEAPTALLTELSNKRGEAYLVVYCMPAPGDRGGPPRTRPTAAPAVYVCEAVKSVKT